MRVEINKIENKNNSEDQWNKRTSSLKRSMNLTDWQREKKEMTFVRNGIRNKDTDSANIKRIILWNLQMRWNGPILWEI